MAVKYHWKPREIDASCVPWSNLRQGIASCCRPSRAFRPFLSRPSPSQSYVDADIVASARSLATSCQCEITCNYTVVVSTRSLVTAGACFLNVAEHFLKRFLTHNVISFKNSPAAHFGWLSENLRQHRLGPNASTIDCTSRSTILTPRRTSFGCYAIKQMTLQCGRTFQKRR